MLRSFCDYVHGHICDFIMNCKLDKLGKSATETFDMIRHVYCNEATSRARVSSARTIQERQSIIG